MQARREGVWAWTLVVRNLNEVRAGGPAPEVTNPPTGDLDAAREREAAPAAAPHQGIARRRLATTPHGSLTCNRRAEVSRAGIVDLVPAGLGAFDRTLGKPDAQIR